MAAKGGEIRKQSIESALEKSEARFRQVVESAPNAMVMINADGLIEMVNAQAERLFGYPRGEILGRPVEMLVPERYRPNHPHLRGLVFGDPQSGPMGDLYGLRKDGSEFPVEIGLNPIETEEGPMVLSAIVDISDRKQKEERIHAALKEKDVLLGEIHHRVKNNLQVVYSLLQLQSANIKDETALKLLTESQNRIRSMALIHQKLYESKDFASVDFKDFLDSLAPILVSSYSVDPVGVTLAISAAEVSLPINAAIPCGLIVNELVSNALKHAFPGRPAGPHHGRPGRRGGRPRRLVGQRRRRRPAAGPGPGQVGHARPAAGDHARRPAGRRGRDQPRGPHPRSPQFLDPAAVTAPKIIAVEDERIVALHLKQQLQNLGYEVPVVAASGEAALRSIIEHRPDLVLMDIHIEGPVDGIDTAAQIPAELGIPVIYLTAYSEEATLERARATKPYGYLIKPYSERELHATIQMALARRDVERALRVSEEQLRQAQKMEAIGQLTGGVAHDFNNLLGVIIGNIDLLRSLRPDDVELDELTLDALNAALGGAELTRRLLAFARRQPLQPQRIELTALVGGTVKLLRRVIGDNIEISLKLAKDTGPVMADPAQLEAALTNLATNARDAMPSGGKLRIATSKTHLDEVYAASRPDVAPGDYAMVEVTDTGEGMPPEVIERIFEPFYTTKGRDKGTGLGLSMVFGFLKQSGGHVAVYSEVGVGTTFRLYLPSLTGAAAPAAPAQPTTAVEGRGETVLVVEDNDALRRIALRELRALGYTVLEASSGVMALAQLEAGPVDLLFSDVVMPGGVDGFELARTATARWPSLRVVLTSGFPQTKLEDEFQPMGFRLLTKPYRRTDLAKALREMLDSAEAAAG